MSPGSGGRPATTDHPASRLVDTRRQPAVAGPAARSPQWGVAVLLALLFGVGAAIARRPDIAVLGALFALIAVSTPRRFGNQHVPTVEFDRSTRGPLLGGARRRILFRDAANNTQAGPALMVVRAVAPGGRESAVVTTTAESTGLGIRVPRGGRRDLLVYRVSAFSPDLGICRHEAETGKLTAMLQPQPDPVRRLPIPSALRAHAGNHHARLRGGGTELRDVGPLKPGDDRRHIDWRASARSTDASGIPLVRRYLAPADAGVTLAIDARVDFPGRVAAWIDPTLDALRMETSLQLTRSAAGSLAAAYLARGDRVGMLDAVGFSSPVRPAAGYRQLELVRRRLAALMVSASSFLPRRLPTPAPGTLVYFFSPLLDHDVASIPARWVRAGHIVAVVDTLPEPDATDLPFSEAQALTLLMATRAAVRAELAAEGIEVLPAAGLRESVERWGLSRARANSLPGGVR
ncbi:MULTISPECIES: DUF58 domain-containing protein [Micrococcaceae]|uniref:DUF58 domain-containing protein n=1 Tax=Micrococcaceae TaxID=1268 RepID=UPI000B355534|nr:MULTISPECIES: DUF58 domain-containing protein [Micrococcaceae]PCC25662.1 DUF58 domain-containing protein [Glutamicibacter sp. BW78]